MFLNYSTQSPSNQSRCLLYQPYYILFETLELVDYAQLIFICVPFWYILIKMDQLEGIQWYYSVGDETVG